MPALEIRWCDHHTRNGVQRPRSRHPDTCHHCSIFGQYLADHIFNEIKCGIQTAFIFGQGFMALTPIAGKAFVISPRENFVVFGLGMSNLTTNKNEWAETGSDVFETLIASIKFKEEK
jgi:hypothetical protein